MLVPRMLVSIPTGGATPPSISSFTTSTTQAMSCGPSTSWIETSQWTIVNPDNSLYKLKLIVNAIVLGSNINCSSGSQAYNTGQAGTPGQIIGNTLTLTFTLQVLRRADDVVMATAQAVAQEVYEACG